MSKSCSMPFWVGNPLLKSTFPTRASTLGGSVPGSGVSLPGSWAMAVPMMQTRTVVTTLVSCRLVFMNGPSRLYVDLSYWLVPLLLIHFSFSTSGSFQTLSTPIFYRTLALVPAHRCRGLLFEILIRGLLDGDAH